MLVPFWNQNGGNIDAKPASENHRFFDSFFDRFFNHFGNQKG